MKKMFLILFVALLSITLLTSCKNDNDNKKEEKIDFYAVVSKVTGTEVNENNVPKAFTIGSDGSYCKIDTNPSNLDDYYSALYVSYVESMNEALGLPEYLFEDMKSTTFSQGKQTEEFEKITVTYSYHPDKGLEVTYKLK